MTTQATPTPTPPTPGTASFAKPITVATGSQTFASLTYDAIDSPSKQTVKVRFAGVPTLLPIWNGAAYVAAGDWTQAQLDTAVAAALGDSPAAVIQSLYLAAQTKRTIATTKAAPPTAPVAKT